MAQSPERVYRKRVEAGLSQDQAASMAGIVRSHLSGIENGQRGASPAVLCRIAAALGCNVADLMPDESAAA